MYKRQGYEPAQLHPESYHGVGPFIKKNGMAKKPKEEATYTDIFAKTICELAQTHEKLITITAAMKDGCGLKGFAKRFPDRFFDVGIAEEHAVTFACGLAAGGFHPFFAVYSSFLQRGYDQILHDMCMQNLPVTPVSYTHLQNDVGQNTDVMDGGSKTDTMIMLLRTMAPQVLAADEAGGEEDIKIFAQAKKWGTALLTTAHGTIKQHLFDQKISGLFSRYIEIQIDNDCSRNVLIYDQNRQLMTTVEIERSYE